MSEPILTERLELVPATREMVLAALSGNDALGVSLGALVPPTWPPEFLDPASLEFVLERMPEGQAQSIWWLYFVILPGDRAGRTLIGSAGTKGRPRTTARSRWDMGSSAIGTDRATLPKQPAG